MQTGIFCVHRVTNKTTDFKVTLLLWDKLVNEIVVFRGTSGHVDRWQTVGRAVDPAGRVAPGRQSGLNKVGIRALATHQRASGIPLEHEAK